MSKNQYKFYHRANSANPQTPKKQRPHSGPNFKDLSNGDITQSFRHKWQNNNFKINKNINQPILTNQQIGRKKRISSKLTNKSVEQLFEDNMQLKKQNNKLIQQLTQIKGRFQAKSKKGTQKAKQFDLQFQKQLYWGGSKTYLISGIKYQYQKLKQKFDQQKKQYQRLKKAFLQAKIPEYQIYAQNIENQNKRLADKLAKMIAAANKIPQSSRKVSQVIISQNQQKIKKLEQKISELNNELEYGKQNLRQKQKKIIFLQKILIEKDNKDYNQSKRFRKLQKTVKQLTDANIAINEQINKVKVNEQEKRKQLLKKHKERKKQLREQFTKQILQLQNKIQYLIEDKRQLQNNLSKLKMSISAGPQRSGVQRRNSICSNSGSSLFKGEGVGSPTRNNGYATSTMLIPHAQIPQASSFHGYESDYSSVQGQRQKKSKPRVMQTANRKHSDQAIKQRKVDYSQIGQIGQLIRLRLISVGMNVQAMKKLFDRKQEDSKKQEDAQKRSNGLRVPVWQDTYINMKQVKTILKSTPFNLSEGSAHLLGRYMIEDCNEEYVYCDENNQNKREIVKSIMKSLLGDYSLPTQKEQAEIADFKVKYLINFYSALKTYYPNGKVSKKKFMEVLTSMGTDMSDKSMQALVARIVAKSQNLSQLEYFELEAL